MTVDEFDHGYWYATELKAFARTLGLRASSLLRKDQLERAVRSFLTSGRMAIANAPAGNENAGARDSDAPLTMKRRIVRYTNDPATKEFLEREARRLVPGLRLRSGARYRLNRWREAQLSAGARVTYGDLVKEYVRLCESHVPFARVPHGRYINFASDFFAHQPHTTRAEMIAAWHELKVMDCAKTYDDWAKNQVRHRSRSRS